VVRPRDTPAALRTLSSSSIARGIKAWKAQALLDLCCFLEFYVGILHRAGARWGIYMTDDTLQLRQFVEKGDEDAFRQLVLRHFGLVYGAALRLTNRDAGLAQDVAQCVFTTLARKARVLPPDIVLAGWLHKATRFTAAKAVRSEQRRRIREQEAVAMQDLTSEPSPEWDQVRPVIDAALAQLNAKDRDAILLRFLEGQSFRAIGTATGVSDDAAQKRVGRALEKLRAVLAHRGVPVAGCALSNLLSAAVVAPMPDGVALSVAKAALAKAAAIGQPSLAELVAQKFTSFKIRIAAGGVIAALAGGTLVFWSHAAPRSVPRSFVTVDLTGHYNAELDKSWTPDYGNNDLASLGEGRHDLHGVLFDVHGVIQLEGSEWKKRGYNFPEIVTGIRIGAKARLLHLLHANSAFADPPGTEVASVLLHYTDGEEARFEIRQGLEILDWWEWPGASLKRPSSANTTVAWRGNNPPAEHNGARVRLFDTAFVNPHPEREIQSMDYISAMAGSAPFMAALTIEP
jgi:RNA polymerase sigma factor (sigma-70 family)